VLETSEQTLIANELIQLTRKVKQGDVVALYQLGIRLLLGDRAPYKPVDGVGLLVDAHKGGHAEAPALLSVLHALGLHVRQGWGTALELLAISAERGNQNALEQLAILARTPYSADMQSRELLSLISLESWVGLPASTILHKDPLIMSYPQFAPAAMCEWLIRKSASRLRPAQVYDAVAQQVTYHQTRTNTLAIYNLVETDLIQLVMQARMSVCTGQPFRHFEASTVLHYEVGQAIHNHFDFVDPDAPDYAMQIQTQGQRVITFLLYLNDNYEGGETAFPLLGMAHKGQAGEGMYFVNALPDGGPDTRTLHAGVSPTRGEKWVVSQFIRNRQTF